MIANKYCKFCESEHLLTKEFWSRLSTSPICKSKKRKDNLLYREQNRERLKVRDAEYHSKNKERRNSYTKEWHSNNK